MRIARSVLPLVVVAAGLLGYAYPALSLENRGQKPNKEAQQTAKAPPPPVKNTEAEQRISRKESRMTRRDQEIDKRMKQQKR